MRYAEAGVNLEIDLSRGSIEKEESDPKDTELYLGGSGINSKILWDRVPPEVKPFDPDNLLIFGTGLLTGTPFPAVNRTCVTTIAPPSYRCVNALMGGFWGPELKHAGYDRVILRGKSPNWAYLWINDDKVEIRDASHLVGKSPLETLDLIRQELKDDQVQVACIGVAGENKGWMSTIETSRASASKGGVGAIMGDKKLKAIVVRGTQDINLARPAEVFELTNDLMKNADIERGSPLLDRRKGSPEGSLHYDNFSWGYARERRKNYSTPEMEKTWRELSEERTTGQIACYNCPRACADVINYPGVPPYFLKCWPRHSYMMSAKLDQDARADFDFEFKLCGISYDYGLDAFAAPFAIALAFELLDFGILTDEDFQGMPSDKMGRYEWMLDKVARREGIGDIFADGTYWAAQRIGKGAENFVHNSIKKLEQAPSKFAMLNYTYYLMHVCSEKSMQPQTVGSYPMDPLPTREMREEWISTWVQVPDVKYGDFKEYFLNWEPRSHETIQEATEIVRWNETMRYVDDAVGICSFWGGFAPAGSGGKNSTTFPYHIHSVPKMIAAATGMDMDEDKLWDTAARDRNLIRSINVRLGLRRADEEECEDHYKRRDPEMEAKLKDAYYELWGWNNDGIPDEALDRLDLDYIKEDFKQRRIL